MKNFSIELANSSQSYLAGEVVQGRVIIENDKPLKVKEVALLLEGTGRVHWSLIETFTSSKTKDDGKTRTVPKKKVRTYSETEKYVSLKMSLAGDGQNTLTLPTGTTVYPFQFALPTSCPSSFTTKFGYVAYFLEAELIRPILRRNKKFAVSFTVNGLLDLNSEPGANQPTQLHKVRGSNLFACRTGQVRFLLHLPRTGYVPGEILDFSCEITNSSNRHVSGVKASLNQVIKYQTKMKSKVERRQLDIVDGPEFEAGEHEVWKPNSIQIPNLPPSRLGGTCKIIDVQYFIRFQINISGLSKSLSGELPFLIGTSRCGGESSQGSGGCDDAAQISKSSQGQSSNIRCISNDSEFTSICDNNERYSWSVTNNS